MSYTEAALIILASYGYPDVPTLALMATIPLILLAIIALALGALARLAQVILEPLIEETDR